MDFGLDLIEDELVWSSLVQSVRTWCGLDFIAVPGLLVRLSPQSDPVFWGFSAPSTRCLLLDQETISISILLLLVFTHNPPLVERSGTPRPLTLKETALQTKQNGMRMKHQQVDTEGTA